MINTELKEKTINLVNFIQNLILVEIWVQLFFTMCKLTIKTNLLKLNFYSQYNHLTSPVVNKINKTYYISQEKDSNGFFY